MPENQETNRKPGTWKPGQTGNPKGRPRLGNSLAGCLRDYLESRDKGDKVTRREHLVEKLYGAAMGDNCIPAARLILETLGMLDIEARLTAMEKALERVEAGP